MLPIGIKAEAIRLRVEEKLPSRIIAERLGVKILTCYDWLVGYPLSADEARKYSRPARKSLVGQRFGRLLVVERQNRFESGSKPKIFYKCVCDCGRKVTRAYCNLKGGDTRSCGCLKKEVLHRRKQDDHVLRRNMLWRVYRVNARKAERNWGLLRSDFEMLIAQDCTYCGAPAGSRFNGLDRIENDKGYELGNVTPCCWACNRAKTDWSTEEFLVWIRKVYEHNQAPQFMVHV